MVALGAFEVASRLSYFIWGSLPDDDLLDAATKGELSTDAQIEAQARRLLADPKAHRSIAAFFSEFLELKVLPSRAKDPTIYTSWSDGLANSMVTETTTFGDSVVFDANGSLATLLGADFSYVDGAVGGLYGMSASKATTFEKAQLDPSKRLGLLTQPSFLTNFGAATGSHPVRRGKAVYEKLLCGELPAPPPNVPAPKPASSGGRHASASASTIRTIAPKDATR